MTDRLLDAHRSLFGRLIDFQNGAELLKTRRNLAREGIDHCVTFSVVETLEIDVVSQRVLEPSGKPDLVCAAGPTQPLDEPATVLCGDVDPLDVHQPHPMRALRPVNPFPRDARP